ncbi:TolC family protein [Deminuibacter soli]|uniref:TolC family protein n=1 Tax=Deminuibacter soli TaxID=2291815 RepID=A0A3E1NFR3_9BACT|nr:TolC family protein [Deminuibacter soli]RFM26810.1 TolC family protein [Deminuibacter soli]
MKLHRHSRILLLVQLTGAVFFASAQDTALHITLPIAHQMALQQNRLLKIARLRVEESRDSLDGISSKYYPNINATGGYLYAGKTDVVIPQGKFGNIASVPIPDRDFKLFEGDHNMILAGANVVQPITQLTKVSTGVKVAKTNVALAQTQVQKAEWQVRQGVEQLYCGILLAQHKQQQAAANIRLTEIQLYDVESALMAGETDSTNHYGLQAQLAADEEKQLQANYDIADYSASLAELLGLPVNTRFELAPLPDSLAVLQPVETYVSQANDKNPDVQAAALTVQKAGLGVASARKEYTPDLSFIAGFSYQSVFDFLPASNYQAGLLLTWKILDFGTRKSVVKQRQHQQAAATESKQYTSDHVSAAVQKAYRQALQAQALVTAAQKAVLYRKKQLEFKQGQLAAGSILKREIVQTRADLTKAETDLFAAQINYRLAYTSLLISAGMY